MHKKNYNGRMSDISALELREWMDTNGHTQESVGAMLGTRASTVSRWLNGKVEMPLPMKKLLAYLIRGEMPFPIQKNDEGWYLDFSAEEFAVIQCLARRDGFSGPEEWVAEKIRAYLRMSNAGPGKSILAAQDQTSYKVNGK